ncbi:acyltransferase [Bacteroidota bacterium]
MVQQNSNDTKLKRPDNNLKSPKNRFRRRFWVKRLLNPFKYKKGKGSLIRSRTRIEVMPWNEFSLGAHSTIEDFTKINNLSGDVIIGENTRIGISNVIMGPVTIGNDVMIAQHVVIVGVNYGYEDITTSPAYQDTKKGLITVSDDVWIGANSVVLPGVTIGKHSVVAAGSIVRQDVPAYSVVSGNPARVIKQYNVEAKSWGFVE